MDFLGLRKSWKRLLQLSKSAILGVIAAGISVVALSVFRYAEYYARKMKEQSDWIQPFSLSVGFSIQQYLALCILLILLCMLISSSGSGKAKK